MFCCLLLIFYSYLAAISTHLWAGRLRQVCVDSATFAPDLVDRRYVNMCALYVWMYAYVRMYVLVRLFLIPCVWVFFCPSRLLQVCVSITFANDSIGWVFVRAGCGKLTCVCVCARACVCARWCARVCVCVCFCLCNSQAFGLLRPEACIVPCLCGCACVQTWVLACGGQ